MNYTSKLHFCTNQNDAPKLCRDYYRAQNEICHLSAVFTGKMMLWQMFHVKHPQCIKLQQNSELQTGRNCNENAKEKKH